MNRRQTQQACAIFGLTVLLIMFAVVAGAEGTSRTVSLKIGNLENRTVTIFTDSNVSLTNTYETSIHQASLTQISSGQRMFNLETFPSGGSLGLEFPRQGSYEFCYSMERESVPENSTCLQIDVVALQAT